MNFEAILVAERNNFNNIHSLQPLQHRSYVNLIVSLSHLGAYKLEFLALLRLRGTYIFFISTLLCWGSDSCVIDLCPWCAAHLSFKPLRQPRKLPLSLCPDYYGLLLRFLTCQNLSSRISFRLLESVQNMTSCEAFWQQDAINLCGLPGWRLKQNAFFRRGWLLQISVFLIELLLVDVMFKFWNSLRLGFLASFDNFIL